MINAIIFDLGNVIVNVNQENFYKKIAEDSGQTVDYIKGYHQNSIDRKNFEKGGINPKEFYRIVAKDLNLSMNFEEFRKCYCGIFTLNSDVANLIKKLKKDFRLVLLSNTDVLHFEFARKKYKIISIFDEHVLSYEVGYRKPNPLIFLEAIKKSKTLPWNCIYFDDIREFVYAARLMGIRAFQFRDYGKLVNDLSNAKVL